MKISICNKQTTHRTLCTLLCALTMTIVGCSKEEPNAQEGNKRRITAKATTPEEGPDTRVSHSHSGFAVWRGDDQFRVWPLGEEENYAIFERTDKEGGTNWDAEFGGNLSCQDGAQLCAIYPSMPVNNNEIRLGLINQTGDHNKANVEQYMYSTGTLKDNVVAFSFKQTVAVIEVGWPDNTTLIKEKTSIKLTATGLHIEALLKMTADGPELFIQGDDTSRRSVHIASWPSDPALIRVFPSSMKDIEIELTDGISTYVGTLPDKDVVVAKIYRTRDILTFAKK